RHTFNQRLRDLGLGIEDRQALLAHASSSTTKIYTHPNLDLAREYVNKLPVFDSTKSSVT
ncbi:MAG TPA: site-specific integrase, partial [Candidatus Marinimicrobia bacterium]|nr:site-specific integrase [Candidatus Neomarinimicrobiota bacterium]